MPKLMHGNGTSQILMSSHARKCPRCGLYTHQWEDTGQLEESVKKDWDISAEGTQLISERFKATLDSLGVTDLEYKPMSAGGYAFRPKRSVFLDLSSCEIETQDFCLACGRFKTFLGGVDAKIMAGESIGDCEIVRSFQSLGSEDYRAELTIFGDGIAQDVRKVQTWRNTQWRDVPYATQA